MNTLILLALVTAAFVLWDLRKHRRRRRRVVDAADHSIAVRNEIQRRDRLDAERRMIPLSQLTPYGRPGVVDELAERRARRNGGGVA